jgi:hypothetical protein
VRRIIRRLAKIGYWLTLFACAALTGGSGVIWVRSQFVSDEVFCSLDSYKPGPTVDTLRWKHRAIDIWTNCARTGCIRIRLLNDHLMAKANSGRIRHDGIEVDHFSLPASPILDDDKLKFDLVGFGEYLERSDSKYGKVEQPGHRCDGLWVMFATRHVGVFNFTDHPAHCNVALFRAEPPKPVDDGSFWVMKGDMPGLKMAGFAEIVAAR